MGMASKEFFEGQTVDVVAPDEGDGWTEPFRGEVTAVLEDTVTVRNALKGEVCNVAKSKATPVED